MNRAITGLVLSGSIANIARSRTVIQRGFFHLPTFHRSNSDVNSVHPQKQTRKQKKMAATNIELYELSSWTVPRLLSCVFLQQSRLEKTLKTLEGTQEKAPDSRSNFAIVTGGGRGLGLFVAEALSNEFNYQVLSASRQRNSWKGEFEQLDLSDFASIDGFVQNLASRSSAKPCSLLVLNSAVANQDAFRTNVLGNARLVHQLLDKKVLSSTARVVLVTGDIYVTEADCDPDFKGTDARAYSQSKVGLMWYGFQLHKRFPDLQVCLVHPAVSPTGLFPRSGVFKSIFEKMTLSEQDGAKAIVYCSTAHKDKFLNGGYFINTCGWVKLPKQDVALDENRQVKFWEETLSSAFL